MSAYPKFRAVREERISRANIRRGIDKMRLREAFDELDEEAAELEALIASDAMYNDEEEARLDKSLCDDLDRELEDKRLFREEYPSVHGYLFEDYDFCDSGY